MMHHRITVAFLTAALVGVGCGSEEPPETVAPEPPGQTGQAPDTAGAGDRAAQALADSIAAAAEIRDRATEAIRTSLTQRINFDYDQSALTTASREILRSKLDGLRCNSGVSLRVEGHADERGSTEYNLVLGNDRAQAAKDFLVGFGIDESRLSTISHGEERPVMNASSEQAWAQNRRDEFVFTAGANSLMPCG